MPQLYTLEHHNANYNDESELYQIEGIWYLKSSLTHWEAIEEVSHAATEEDVEQGFVIQGCCCFNYQNNNYIFASAYDKENNNFSRIYVFKSEAYIKSLDS